VRACPFCSKAEGGGEGSYGFANAVVRKVRAKILLECREEEEEEETEEEEEEK
jgi:hypothetical protein